MEACLYKDNLYTHRTVFISFLMFSSPFFFCLFQKYKAESFLTFWSLTIYLSYWNINQIYLVHFLLTFFRLVIVLWSFKRVNSIELLFESHHTLQGTLTIKNLKPSYRDSVTSEREFSFFELVRFDCISLFLYILCWILLKFWNFKLYFLGFQFTMDTTK